MDKPITLDPSELLGLSQVAKVSGGLSGLLETGLLSKAGPGVEEPPDGDGEVGQPTAGARLLSKIGEFPDNDLPETE